MKERLVENVQRAAEDQIGYMRVSRRKRICKPWWNDERLRRSERE